MRLAERLRLCYRMLIFVISTILLWIGLELEVLCLRQDRLVAINRWVPMWAKFNLRVFGVQVEARGKYVGDGRTYPSSEAEDTGRIFIANHQSGMDIPILFTVAQTHVISRHDLAQWPLLGRAAKRIGTLFVDRGSRRSGASVLREVDNALKRGEAVAMFPEGTAYDGDYVHEFRQGAFSAARRAGAEVIPIGIAYDNEAAYYARRSFVPHMARIAGLRRMRVAVEVGQPLRVEECSPIATKELAREHVQELFERATARLQT